MSPRNIWPVVVLLLMTGGCAPQLLRTLCRPKTHGSLRCSPPECNNVTQTHHNLLILKSDGVFADHRHHQPHRKAVMITSYKPT